MISELGRNQPGILSYIRFLFAYVSISLRPVIVKAHKPETTGKKLCAHGKTTRRATLGGDRCPQFDLCYNRAFTPPKWRYRLGVRTEDSQSSNPGSIPGSATSIKVS
jgi:hypothetical protein